MTADLIPEPEPAGVPAQPPRCPDCPWPLGSLGHFWDCVAPAMERAGYRVAVERREGAG